MVTPLVLSWTLLSAAAAAPAAPPDLLTRAESTGFRETARYPETLALLRRLEAASPWIRVTSFGRSPEGRDLLLVIASKDRAFDPASAARTGKPVVLVQAGIHAGEIDGKDAGFMLLRDMAVTRTRAALLDRMTVLFLPIYNVDGHERFGPHHRINQDGPAEMGWRTTSRNLNLNRDYAKADAVETRAWLRLFTSWWPDLTVDCHVTDGADFRYDVTYGYEAGPTAPPAVAAWITRAVEAGVLPALSAGGHLAAPYVALKDDTDPAAGLAGWGATPPALSTGYTLYQNRPSFLIETHALKDYATRVRGTYDTLAALLAEVARDPDGLREAVRRADREAAGPGRVVLETRSSEATETVPFLGVEYRREPSEISGATRIVYGRAPLDLRVERPAGVEVTATAEKPRAYLVPPQWTEAIAVLEAHGLRLERLPEARTMEVDGWRLDQPAWQAGPYEGRHPVSFGVTPLPGERRTFPPGTVVVPMDQRGSAIAAYLLEPAAPGSLVRWGFFDAIFERKEYAEGYVLEDLARRMLAADPGLRAPFEAALADPAFAASPQRRLEWFYRRSPYWDDRVGVYPVARLPR